MYDILVVGAGPAGAVAAGRCAELGLRTLLLDRKEFPRFKACGGGLTRAAQGLLGARLPQRALETSCDRLIADFGGKRVDVQMPRPLMATVRREAFDLCLVEAAIAAGAEFHPGLEAEEVEVGSGYAEVWVRRGGAGGDGNPRGSAESVRASLLIVADGVMGRISRRLAGAPDPASLAFCLVAEAVPDDRRLTAVRTGNSLGGLTGGVPGRAIQCFYGEVPAGYGWIFPLNGHLNVGLGTPARRARDVLARWPRYLQNNGLRLLGQARGAHIPVGGPRRRLSGDHWILVGDSAGLADPFSGEGLRYAAASGHLAGEMAAESLERGDSRAQTLRSYDQRVENSCGRELGLAARVQHLVAFRPRVMKSLFTGDSTAFRDLLGILDGTVTYSELLSHVLPRLPRAYATAMFTPWGSVSSHWGPLPGRPHPE